MRALFSSLRVRLMTLVALSLLPVVGLALYTAEGQRRRGTRLAHAEALRVARLCAASQEQLIESAGQLLMTLAKVPVVRALDGQASSALFAEIIGQFTNAYANIGLISPEGEVLASGVPAPPGTNLAFRPYFQRAMASGALAIGEFQIGKIAKKYTLNVALPLFNDSSEIAGVLYVALDLAWLQDKALEAELPRGSALGVVDLNGTIVARVPERPEFIGTQLPEDLRAAMLSGRNSEGTMTARGIDGLKRLISFAPIRGGDGATFGYVSVGVPTEVALAEAREILWHQLVILAVIAAVGVTAAWFASGPLVLNRVRAVVGTSRRLGAGDLTARTGLTHDPSELGELARSFDEMAAAMEARRLERQRNEEALRRSEEMFRNLFEASPDAIFVEDHEARVLDANPAACALHGFTREQLVGRHVRELVPAGIVDQVLERFPRWVRGDLSNLESLSLTAAGREVPVELRVSRTTFSGQPALLFHVRDITERKLAQAALQQAHDRLEQRVSERTTQLATANTALRESTERFELVMQGTNDGVWDWDLRTDRAYFSPRAIALLGYESGGFPRDRAEWEACVHPADLPATRRRLEAHLRGETPAFEMEFRFRGADGRYRWILCRGIAARDAQDQPVRVAGSYMDLTERNESRVALERLAEDLRRSNEELEQFAYVASHDLQEPLRMVASYTQLLERRYKDKLDDDARTFIAFAVDGARRMQRFINDLLDYSRVGTRGKPFEQVDLNTVLNHTRANLKIALEEKQALLTNDPLPIVVGDASQLTRLFQNLVGNAVKFCRERRPEVHLGARRGEAEWIFSVRDNGIGIPPEAYERIFVIFQRLHTREEFAGTGIGLSVCKKIVERHGGRIWVESAVGAGTTFFFTIPVAPDDTPRHTAVP